MSSGEKALVFNTRERAVSTDQNRLQSFIARDRSQLARRQYNDFRQNSFQYPGVETANTGAELPLSADVYGGLMVDPLTTSLLVTAGEVGCLFPDPAATADDSPYMLIDDPGMQTAGVLVFTANATGQIRIDLVECQPIAVTLESDNRDIFNPGTGGFVPTNVPKVTAFRLQYRVRVGVGGSGMPALQAGWLPLAVVVVASSAADFSACDFYDVRPLVEERTRPQPLYVNGSLSFLQYSPVRDSEYYTEIVSAATTFQGYSETEFGGYPAGGWLRRSSPSFSGSFTGGGIADGDPDFVNVTLAENQTASDWAPSAFALVYLAAFFPGGLPRWVRYSHSTVGGGLGRVPKGPRGILLATTKIPYANGFVAPVAIGHGFTSAVPGVVVAATAYNSGGTALLNVWANNGEHNLVGVGGPPSLNKAVTSGSLTTMDFTLVGGVDFPANASALYINISLTFNNPAGTLSFGRTDVWVMDATSSDAFLVHRERTPIPAGATNLSISNGIIVIPLKARISPFSTASSAIRIHVLYSPDSTDGLSTSTPSICRVSGWKLGS